MTIGSPPASCRRAALCAFAVALGGVIGCKQGPADVSGRVTHQGKTVVCGSVTLVGPDGMTKTARINPDGTYSVAGVGSGTVQVAVVSDDPARPLDPYKAAKTHGKAAVEPIDDSGRDPDAGRSVPVPPNDRSNWAEPGIDRSKWFLLPKKYELVSTSGVTIEVKPGPNSGIDIELP
jgi:hypothetical protein